MVGGWREEEEDEEVAGRPGQSLAPEAAGVGAGAGSKAAEGPRAKEEAGVGAGSGAL